MRYPSCLPDEGWELIADFFPAKRTGRPRKYDPRHIVDGIFYVVDNGVKWTALPNDFPPWKSVYNYFRDWSESGLWNEMSLTLTEAVRFSSGREPSPSLSSIDSQSQTAEPGVKDRGLDGGKKNKRTKEAYSSRCFRSYSSVHLLFCKCS